MIVTHVLAGYFFKYFGVRDETAPREVLVDVLADLAFDLQRAAKINHVYCISSENPGISINVTDGVMPGDLIGRDLTREHRQDDRRFVAIYIHVSSEK